MKKRIFALFIGLVLLAVCLSGCSLGTIRISGGAKAGVYTALLNELTTVWEANSKLKFGEPASTSGSYGNLTSINKGSCDLALCTDDYLVWSRQGRGAMANTRANFAGLLCGLYTDYLHILVRADSDIQSIDDLRGKTIVFDEGETAAYFNSIEILKAAGMSTRAGTADVTVLRQNIYDGINSVMDGEVSAVFGTASLGNEAVQSAILDEDAPLRLLSVDKKYIDALLTDPNTTYFTSSHLTDPYEGVKTVDMLGVKTVLIVPYKMKDARVKNLLATLFDNLDQLSGEHRSDEISLENAVDGLDLRDLHPAALEFFVERGAIAEGSVTLNPPKLS